MGASTIIKILDNPKINQINKLIIQSNNDYYLLRSYLTKNNFYISHESVITENNKHYVNIVFLRGTKNYTEKELKYGPILMYSNKNYYEYLYNKQKEILTNIPKKRIYSRFLVKREIKQLRKLSI